MRPGVRLGITFCLATLARATGELEFAEAALDGAAYPPSIARTESGTCGVHLHEVEGADLQMLGFCSDSTGRGCLPVRLDQMIGVGSAMSVVLAADRLGFELARRGWGNADLARAARVWAATVTAALSGRPVAPRTLMRIAVARAGPPPAAGVDDILPK